MRKTTWQVTGTDANRHLYEVRVNDSDDKLSSYEDAKQGALRMLREHIAPYLQRIDELEADQDRTSGALPPNKAWWSESGKVVTAKTKKRAIELLDESRYGFDLNFTEAGGDWWYRLAREEAIWIEEIDPDGQETGNYFKPVVRDEAARIIEELLSPFRTMPVSELLARIDEDCQSTGVSSDGTGYQLTTKIRRFDWQPDTVRVTGELSDCLRGGCRESKYVECDVTECLAGWQKGGF